MSMEPKNNDDGVRHQRNGELEYHMKNWIENQDGESLNWLYEVLLNGQYPLIRSKAEVQEYFGPPPQGSSDFNWCYCAPDNDVSFLLIWDPANPSLLQGWKMP